jgi:hypothetical protein
MANLILQQDATTPSPHDNPQRLLERIGSPSSLNVTIALKCRFARRYNYQRALCEDPRAIRDWFKRLKEVQEKHGIQDEDMYNFDETGFAVGLIVTTKVVTRSNMPGRPHLIQPGQREWVTTIECIGSTGFSGPTCINFKGKVHIQGWFEELDLPHDWRIEVSANGWTTDQIGLHWLGHCFIPAPTARTKRGSRLLVLDGHGSHLTPEFPHA